MYKAYWAAGAASLAVLAGAAYAAAPAKAPAPIANYWMDVATTSGFGAGMGGGGRPSMGAIMGMMRGGSSVMHSLELRLASKQKAAGTPDAQHFVPPSLQMGPTLPLVTPVIERTAGTPHTETPGTYEKPKGRMLIYWGCGEHVSAGQPTVIDFAKLASGQIPKEYQSLARMGAMMGRSATPPQVGQSAGYGEWPNKRDSRPVPAAGSLLGAHRIEGNYSPPISFTVGAGQDFMPALGLREAGALPSGAQTLSWQAAPQATGYALSMFGSGQNGDVIIWTSAKGAAMSPNFDYLSPAEVKRQVTAGAVLAPSVTQCVLPAEVATASPTGMVMGIGYGPEVFFAEAPKAPKWSTRLRYKSTATLMRGMGAMMGGDEGGNPRGQAPGQPAKKKRRGLGGLGGVLGNLPIP
ncbi:hypothetical protein G7077_07980 [Sphingomonas piscis]|uniref:Uncharacterized protein n=1 Tax=Sphingomonas piscis TaxID=2714943 RepID=A0A6G7YQ29_9SPHN|nr:hypothetical protein [Sphingomonas piscis]QIK78841.1 hypothetical protein G7077_07980 [Sphingomonas piscis]